MSKSKALKKILFASILIFVIIATHIISIAYYKNYGQYNEGAKRVYKMPEGYIPLQKIYEYTEGKLRYIGTDHNSVLIRDSDDMFIHNFNISLNNSWFIVRYKDEYYINEIEYEKLLRDAKIIAEQRNRIYNLGDAVMLRGSEIVPWIIIIDSLEMESIGESVAYTIKFTTNPSVSENKILKIFGHVETDKGTIINEFAFVDEGTVQVELPAGEKIGMLILTSPANNELINCVRRVRVEE